MLGGATALPDDPGNLSSLAERLIAEVKAQAILIEKLRLPDPHEEKGKPKRRPIPDHVPRTEIELLPAQDDCAACGGRLRQIGEDGEP